MPRQGLKALGSGFHYPEPTVSIVPTVINRIATANIWMVIKLGTFSLETVRMLSRFKKHPEKIQSAVPEQVNTAKIRLNSIILS